MIEAVPPPAILIIGALMLPLFRGRFKTGYLLGLPCLSLLNLALMEPGRYWTFRFLSYDLILGRVDALSMAFGTVFVIITFIGILYGLHDKDDSQKIAALIYSGGALGVTFTGDLLSLYIFWEILAIASVYLVLARHQKAASAAAFRYFAWHFFGGICLLAGIILYVIEHGTPSFSYIGLTGWASYFIFTGFCLNAAIFPFHAWLPDAYPQATVTGAVFMSALTTKSAVYILARTIPGTEL